MAKKKPPLGLVPKHIWLEDRLNAINSAIERYIEKDYIIPEEWINERNEIITTLDYGKSY